METRALTSRPLAADDWNLAARLKRDRDYAEIVDGVGAWSEPEVDALYRERWGHGEAEYQHARLRQEVGDGELRGWFRDRELVGFAAVRETNLLADEGPRLLVVRQLHVLRPEAAAEIAADLAAHADARAVEETDLELPAEHLSAFEREGFAARIVTARRRWRG